MQTTKPIDFRCPNCGYQTKAEVTTIIDVAHNPEAKGQLLSGGLNVIQCPNCGTPSTASTPMLFHDASKELLITFVPMALGMSDQEADKFIGVLMNEVTNNMDQKLVRGYIFQPRRALTMQGLVEQILEADGITKEMQEAQRERARLAQMFLQTDPEQFEALVQEHDDKIDEDFFTTLSMIAQQTAQQGRADMAEYIIGVQQRIAELSSAGQALMRQAQEQQALLENIAEKLQGLGQRPTPADVVALVRPYAEDEDALQAFVGLARPIFDYNFFQTLSDAIKDAPQDETAKLEAMRDTLLQLTQVIDQQQQQQMQEAANLLREIINHADLEEAVRANLGRIDETFMGVLELNIQEAEKNSDLEASARLKALRDTVMEALQANMRPDVRFINDLLSSDSEATAREMINNQAAEFGPDLLETFDTLIDVIQSQGQTEVVERLRTLRKVTEDVISEA